jgi:hypothetical protein
MHFNILLLSTPRSYKRSLSLSNTVCTCPLLHKFYVSRLFRYSQFDLKSVRWRIQIMKILFTQFPQVVFHLVPLRPTNLPQHHILETLSLCSSINDQLERPDLTPIHNNALRFDHYIFEYQSGRQNILYRMMASTSWFILLLFLPACCFDLLVSFPNILNLPNF